MARERGRRGGIEVAKPQIFDGMLLKVAEFIIAYKLYIRMRMREELCQVQFTLGWKSAECTQR